MRIDEISLQDCPPLRSLDIKLTSNIVVIAGPNGAGKTRLKNAIISSYEKPNEGLISLTFRATRQEEISLWGDEYIRLVPREDSQILRNYLGTRAQDQTSIGIVFQIEANRKIGTMQIGGLPINTPDPDEQGSDYGINVTSVQNRWQTVFEYVYKKAAIRNQKIAKFILDNPDLSFSSSEIASKFPDALIPYQKLFAKLFPGKTMEPIDPGIPQEFLYRVSDSPQPLSFNTLSSGELEVVIMAFGLIYKQISHSVIIIDEPESHLNPALLVRFIETVSDYLGETNQLILFSHSADLISTYYSTKDVFILDHLSSAPNQAYKLSDILQDHPTIAKLVSSNLGIFTVGKRLLFVEGDGTSLDYLTYQKIAQRYLADFRVVPVNGVRNIMALKSINKELTKSIFGIQMFLIRDRDGLRDDDVVNLELNKHFRCLARPHIENYFLDDEILSLVAKDLFLDADKTNPSRIKQGLFEIASKQVLKGVEWYVHEFINKNGGVYSIDKSSEQFQTPDSLADHVFDQMVMSIKGLSEKFEKANVHELVNEEYAKLNAALSSGRWMHVLPGKQIFNRFCADFFRKESSEIRDRYVDKAIEFKPEVFQEIIDIFNQFSLMVTEQGQ